MADWASYMCDVHGAFLMGECEEEKKLFMEIPRGFESKYAKDAFLRLRKTIYGLKQAALMFWKLLLKCMRSMKFDKSWADPCMYYKETENGLVLWLSWIDDCLCVGPDIEVKKARADILARFECDDVGDLKEYLGCKIDRHMDDIG